MLAGHRKKHFHPFPPIQKMVAVILSDKPAPGFKYGYELSMDTVTKEPGNNETLIKIQAAALNHR